MKLFAIIALSATLLSGVAALAYDVDNQSMSSPSKSENFSDPDDKTPLSLNGSGKTDSSAQDQSAMHYEYDPQNGVYVPVTTPQK